MNADLARIYAKLPKLECSGQCWESCGPIGLSPAEAKSMEAASRARGDLPEGAEAFQLEDGTIMLPHLRCPFLDFAGRCSVYSVRPMICRLWGVIESMPCPHGCVPEGGRLSNHGGFVLLAEAMKAGGVKMEPEEIRRNFGGEFEALANEFIAQGMANELKRR